VQPASLDVDSRRAMDAARYLAQFRVLDFVEISGSAAGFPGQRRIGVAGQWVEFGDDGPQRNGRATRFVRIADSPGRIGVVDAQVPTALKSAWSR